MSGAAAAKELDGRAEELGARQAYGEVVVMANEVLVRALDIARAVFGASC